MEKNFGTLLEQVAKGRHRAWDLSQEEASSPGCPRMRCSHPERPHRGG